jgi:hypothetical protein
MHLYAPPEDVNDTEVNTFILGKVEQYLSLILLSVTEDAQYSIVHNHDDGIAVLFSLDRSRFVYVIKRDPAATSNNKIVTGRYLIYYPNEYDPRVILARIGPHPRNERVAAAGLANQNIALA